MPILMTGAHGQLGHELARILPGDNLILADHQAYDLTQLAVGGKIAAQRTDIIIHAAAFTNVDGCDHDPNTAVR